MAGPRVSMLRNPLVLAALVGVGLLATARPAAAEGWNLDGRMAPEMVFPEGMNGVTRGTSLSAFRGQVVWVKFILRDCPRCQRELPRAQSLHDRWGRSGLVVLVVVHQFGPEHMRSFMQRNGYTFRLGTDPAGRLAQPYGVRHRPTDYVVGTDGRIRASNGAPDQVILTELGRYRLARLGEMPPALSSVRDSVWNWDYGRALRTVEAAVAAPDAAPEVREAAARVQALAREELEARLQLAGTLEQRRQISVARATYDRVAAHFQGTSLEAAAADARRRFLARRGS